METLRLKADPENLGSPESEKALRQAANLLRRGGNVAFPTETVYGLGANALDETAVGRIFEAKQRPSWDPIIVHVANIGQLERIVEEIPPQGRLLMDAFWPGPLTLLLPKKRAVPAVVTAGRPLVGVRMPRHPVARKLIELADLPIAAPSANSFGRTSPTSARFVLEDLDGRIDAILDGGQTNLGIESTVVDVAAKPPVLYRPGMVTLEQIRSICESVVSYRPPESNAGAADSQPSPGTGLQHYAPRANLVLFTEEEVSRTFEMAAALQTQGKAIGIMLPENFEAGALSEVGLRYDWGGWANKEELAHRLFDGLRQLDAAGVDVILCPLPEDKGIGTAIRDRLLKAANPVAH